MQSLRHEHRLRLLLRAARLSRSVYYYHASKPDAGEGRYAAAVLAMTVLNTRHAERYGYRRMTLALRAEGIVLNHKTVRKLMKQHGLTCRLRRRKYNSYRHDGGPSSANLLARNFHATGCGLKWCTDVTEFRVGENKLYLSAIQDLFNGEIVAWHMTARPVQALASVTLEKALRIKWRRKGLMLHSDQGWHYRTPVWRSALSKAKITQSMSRKGICHDNAVMENFFSHLKVEMYHRQNYDSAELLRKDIDAYIHYYNHERISEKNQGMSPVEYRVHSEKL